MKITIPTKDIGEVREIYNRGYYKYTLEERIKKYIKKELGIDGS